MTGLLALASSIAFVLRVISFFFFGSVIRTQIKQFRYRSVLQPLKRKLLGAVVFLALSNVPILYLNVERILGGQGSLVTTSLATVINAAALLVTAVMLWRAYRFAGRHDKDEL